MTKEEQLKLAQKLLDYHWESGALQETFEQEWLKRLLYGVDGNPFKVELIELPENVVSLDKYRMRKRGG